MEFSPEPFKALRAFLFEDRMPELVLCFFESRDKETWTPLERDRIPEWLCDHKIWDRLIAGEAVRNTLEDAERRGVHYYTATAVDRANVPVDAVLLPARLLPARSIIAPRVMQ